MSAPSITITETADYLAALLGPHDLTGLWIGITCFRRSGGPVTRYRRADDVTGIEQDIAELDARPDSTGVFLAQTLADRPGPEDGRYKADDARVVTHFWVDIDIAGEGHAGGKPYPSTEAEAVRVLDAVGLRPSVVKHSGHGLQAEYWLAEPCVIETEADRREIAALVKNFVDTVRFRAHETGLWTIDAVHDLARVMRVPGSRNRKAEGEDLPVTLLTLDPNNVYELDHFRSVLVDRKYLDQHARTAATSAEDQRNALALVGNLHAVWAQARRGEAQELIARIEESGLGDDIRLLELWAEAAKTTVDDSTMDLALGNSAYHLFRSTGEAEGARYAALMIMGNRLRTGRKIDKVDPSRRVDYLARTLALVVKPRERIEIKETEDVTATLETNTSTDRIESSEIEAYLDAVASDEPADEPTPADKPKKRRKGSKPVIEANKDGRPQVILTGRPFRDIKTDTCKALLLTELTNPRMFLLGSDCVVIISPVSGQLHQVKAAGMVDLLSGRIDFLEIREGDEGRTRVHARPPRDVVDAMLENPEALGLPPIKRTTAVPFFSRSGQLVTKVGYNRETGVYLTKARDRAPIPEVSANPSEQEVDLALGVLLSDLLVDFPFISEADRAAAFALPLTLITREMINGPTPLFAVDAPIEGSGKGLLTEALMSPLLDTYEVNSAPSNPDEWHKTIIATLRGGPALAMFDNVSGTMDAGPLASAITAWPMVSSRLLGSNEKVRVPPPATWVATGNNLLASAELVRRMVPVRIDSKTAKPGERNDFKHPELRTFFEENQGLLAWSWLTLAQSWVSAGRPIAENLPRMGSFEAWVKTVGSILTHIGVDGLLANRSALAARMDGESAAYEKFVWGWLNDPGEIALERDDFGPAQDARESCAGRKCTAQELLEMIIKNNYDLPCDVGNGDIRSKAMRFGHWLKKLDGRHVADGADGVYVVRKHPKLLKGCAVYFLEKAAA